MNSQSEEEQMSWLIYSVMVFILAFLGFKLLVFLPNVLRWALVGFGVGLLLMPTYVPHVMDYYAPAWAPAFFEKLFVAEASEMTKLGALALNKMLLGGGIGAVLGVIASFVIRKSEELPEDKAQGKGQGNA